MQKSRDAAEQRQWNNIDTLTKEWNLARQYLDIAGVIFVVLDGEGNVLLINSQGATVLDYEEKEIIGKNWLDSFTIEHEKRPDKESSIPGTGCEPAHLQPLEGIVVTRYGEERLIEWKISVLKEVSNSTFDRKNGRSLITQRATE